MKFVCDAEGNKTWFRIESETEADQESALMSHAVAKFFRREQEKATQSYVPTSSVNFEQNIGLEAHLQREMPLFLTLRNTDGDGLVTAMLPPGGQENTAFRTIVVGASNADPYPEHGEAIKALGQHFGLTLDREKCFPYSR